MSSKGDSPARGIKNVLSLKRHSRDDGASINSDGKSPRRNSNDSALSKVKSMAKNLGADDDSEHSDGKRSAKNLLGFGKLKDRARRKSQQIDSVEDLNRGRDIQPKETSTQGDVHGSRETLDSQDSSLLPSDSDISPQKPSLVNHPSHVGYLTSSSPQIKEEFVTLDSPASGSSRTSSPTKLKRLLGKSLTMPKSRSPSISPSRPVSRSSASGRPSQTLSPTQSRLSQPQSSRSPSPASKRESTKPTTTIAARRKSKGAETANLPALQLARSQTNKSNNSNESIPSIVTIPDTPPQSAGPMLSEIPLPARAATAGEDYTYRPLAAKSLATHRRIRSDGPPTSKLSQSMAPPLTPLEEARTPVGSRHASGASVSGGFFSSVFSVAQNAANTLTSTLQANNRPKTPASSKPLIEKSNSLGDSPEDDEETATARPSLAIETIGTGDLSLHHLGITNEQPDKTSSPTPSLNQANGGDTRSRSSTIIHNEQNSSKAEDLSAARAVSAAYSTAGTVQSAVTPLAEDVSPPRARPMSMIDAVSYEEKTPQSAGFPDNSTDLTRSGSIRSKLDRHRKRHRNSSGATIGAAIAASHNALAPNSATRFSGFTKANAKRNKDFHNFFRSVPDDDDLIEDYSCALQRDIILAGRIYISEGHVCFSSNILGWVTNLVISFDEIVSVEKESTAMLFANAIAIQTLHARHTFRSLLSRDATYDLIVNIWRLNHPGLESSENGVRLASGTGSKTQRILNGSDQGSEGSVGSNGSYDETDSEDSQDFMDSIDASVNGDGAASNSRKVSTAGNGMPQVGSSFGNTATDKLASSVASLGEFPGPSTHPPTECNESSTHLEKLLKDETIPAPLGKVYSLVFGPASPIFMSRWLQDEIKVADLHMEDTKGLSETKQSRSFSYIKPLANPIGPRTTKCIITEHLDFLDLEKSMTVSCTTQTPDVPSGNLFSTKTKYCFMWGPNNSTRIIMTYAIEWTGKSWLKGPIEKGATDGQTTYANDLVKALKAGLTPRGRSTTQGSKGKKQRRRRGENEIIEQAQAKSVHWGPLQPLMDTFHSTIRYVKPIFSVYTIVAILGSLLVMSWFSSSRVRYLQSPFLQSSSGRTIPNPSRQAAWEEMWQSEEEALWDWLQDRTGLSSGHSFPIPPSDHEDTGSTRSAFGRPQKVAGSSRDLEWAIKLTEDRLASLKSKVASSEKSTKRGKASSAKSGDDPGVEISDEETAALQEILNSLGGSG